MKIYLFRHGATRGNQEYRYVGRTDERILESEKEHLHQRGEFLPPLDGLFVSPYRRCLESAQALFPDLFFYRKFFWISDRRTSNDAQLAEKKFIALQSARARKMRIAHSFLRRNQKTDSVKLGQNGKIVIAEDLREMDFGAFEYKNHQELNGNPEYQKFIDSGGKTAFPGGEEPEAFRKRCREAFCQCIRTAQKQRWETVGFVVHGGTIMAIMEGFAYPRKEYYDYQVKNGRGYLVRMETDSLDTIKLIIEEEIR